MSFAGHVIDMMKRYKQNRELRTIHRERRKDRQKAMETGTSIDYSNLTVEKLEQYKKDTEKRERQEKSHYLLALSVILCAGLVAFLLLWLLL